MEQRGLISEATDIETGRRHRRYRRGVKRYGHPRYPRRGPRYYPRRHYPTPYYGAICRAGIYYCVMNGYYPVGIPCYCAHTGLQGAVTIR